MLNDFAIQANSFCLNFLVIFISIIVPISLVGIVGFFVCVVIYLLKKAGE